MRPKLRNIEIDRQAGEMPNGRFKTETFAPLSQLAI